MQSSFPFYIALITHDTQSWAAFRRSSLRFHSGAAALLRCQHLCPTSDLRAGAHPLPPSSLCGTGHAKPAKEAFQQIMKYNYLGPGCSEETGPGRNFAGRSHGSEVGRAARQFLPMCSSAAMGHAEPQGL